MSATVTTTSLFSNAVVSVRAPPVGMASTAFRMRFVMASRSSAGSPATEGRLANAVCTSTATSRLRISSRQRDWVISSAPRTTSLRSTATKGWSSRIRVNSCSRRTVCAPSRAARSMTWIHRRSCGSCSRWSVSWARPRIDASRLLKSCATPEAISPSARSFSVRTSWSCAAASSPYARIRSSKSSALRSDSAARSAMFVRRRSSASVNARSALRNVRTPITAFPALSGTPSQCRGRVKVATGSTPRRAHSAR